MTRRAGLFARRIVALDWLTGPRIILYGGLICAINALILVFGILFTGETPHRVDFIAFQAAGRLALAGEAAAAYDWDRLRDAQAAILGIAPEAISGYLGWLNPPHFFFAVAPFAPLPYAWAWAAWILACVLVLGFAVRAVSPGAAALVAVFCTPSVLFSLGVGQNGALVAALMAWTLLLLDRRPVLAGIALGLLTIKPQFGLIFPLLLVLTGRWRVFAAATATVLAVVAASWVAFGAEAWRAFLPIVSGTADRYLAPGSDVLPKIQSVHAFLMQGPGQGGLAWALHGGLAAVALALALRLWLRRPEGPEEARAAAAIAAAFLLTPYVWTYDTPAIAIAALFLARAARRDGWLAGEKALLVLAPAALLVVVVRPHSLVGPVAWLVILGLAWRRDAAWRRTAAAAPPELSPAPRGSMSAGT